MPNDQSSATLPIPQPLRVVVGVCLFAGFLCFTVAVGIHNLLNGVSLIASCLWLLLVGAMIVSCCREHGIKPLFTNILGTVTRRHFAWAYPTAANQIEIRFGYEIFGRRHFYLAIPTTRIEEVHWRTGQASDQLGRDVGDWSVALWYAHGDSAKTADRLKKWPNWKTAAQAVYIVGPQGPKEKTAALGHRFLHFLCQSGVCLVQGADDSTFIRQPVVINPSASSAASPAT